MKQAFFFERRTSSVLSLVLILVVPLLPLLLLRDDDVAAPAARTCVDKSSKSNGGGTNIGLCATGRKSGDGGVSDRTGSVGEEGEERRSIPKDGGGGGEQVLSRRIVSLRSADLTTVDGGGACANDVKFTNLL